MDTDSGFVTYGVPVVNFVSFHGDTIKVEIKRTLKKTEQDKRNKKRTYVTNYSFPFHYNSLFKDSTLYLSPVWYSIGSKPPTNTIVKVNVYIPDGTKVFLSNKISTLVDSTNQQFVNRLCRIRNSEFIEVGKKIINTK